MTETIQSLFLKMIVFDRGQPDLIQHFTKVHSYARLIGLGEALSGEMLETLEAAALVHDIAIPLCLENTAPTPVAFRKRKDRRWHGRCLRIPLLRRRSGKGSARWWACITPMSR